MINSGQLWPKIKKCPFFGFPEAKVEAKNRIISKSCHVLTAKNKKIQNIEDMRDRKYNN